MSNRRYNKKIEVWQTGSVSDGQGGTTEGDDVKLADSWAKIKTLDHTKMLSNAAEGILNTSYAISVELRKRDDVEYNNTNQFIKHENISYKIKTPPVEVNFSGSVIKFIAVREEDNE